MSTFTLAEGFFSPLVVRQMGVIMGIAYINFNLKSQKVMFLLRKRTKPELT